MEKCIKLYCDSEYTLLGKIDLSSVVSGADDVVAVNAGADYIRFSVYERANESSKHYKVNISDIRERSYYFIDNFFLGFTECGGFYNRTHSENVYGEFLSQEGYDVYSQDGYILRSTEVECNMGAFKLPVSMSEKAFNAIYDYDAYIYFVGIGDVFTNKKLLLVTNAKHNILPRNVEKTTANEKDAEIIRKELEKDGITKAPINVTEAFVCDLDGDGTDERIIFANSTEEYVRDEVLGNYTMVFIEKEDDVEILHKETSRYDETLPNLETWGNYLDHWTNYSRCVGLYDLNGDGNFEICVELGRYKDGRYMVFSESEDGKYSIVLNAQPGV